MLYRKDTVEKPTPNPQGWCFVDGVMTPSNAANVHSAVDIGMPNNYVNTSWALYQCQQLAYPSANCAKEIIDTFTRTLLGPLGSSTRYITKCTYPTSNFLPLDCECAFECNAGYVLCGAGTATPSCINPGTQSCVSDLPVAKNVEARRRGLYECPRGTTQCKNIHGQGYDCLDISSDLEACGACPGHVDSVDCSSLSGVSSVSCVEGQCIINDCDDKHTWVDGECVPTF